MTSIHVYLLNIYKFVCSKNACGSIFIIYMTCGDQTSNGKISCTWLNILVILGANERGRCIFSLIPSSIRYSFWSHIVPEHLGRVSGGPGAPPGAPLSFNGLKAKPGFLGKGLLKALTCCCVYLLCLLRFEK